MNERILELMAEAGIDVEKLRTYPGGWPREDLIILQDFAELIVRECCQKLENDGMVEVAMEMKEHFGVE